MKTYDLWINTARKWMLFIDMGHEKTVKTGENKRIVR